jgi:serine/threonine-protein kinase HipA
LIERYDRSQGKRLHQQDVCQALSLMASKKYESRGGPKIKDVYNLIQNSSQNKFNDLQMFLKWIVFNAIIGNYDSHAKNISFLYRNGKWSLSPFYDLMSTAIYPGFTTDFSFSVGGQFKVHEWRKKHFEMLESELGLKSKTLSFILNEMIEEIILALPQVEYEGKEILPDAFIHQRIINHIQKMVRIFDQRVLAGA